MVAYVLKSLPDFHHMSLWTWLHAYRWS